MQSTPKRRTQSRTLSPDTNNQIFTFAHSAEIVTPVIESYGCGWFDGGCFIFARALEMWLGGCLAVLLRKEFLNEQTFDHVVLSLKSTHQPLYVDADGVATRDTLLERWRIRERLANVQLEDPASAVRFVGHLRKDSLSCWLADQFRERFGIPHVGWLEHQAGLTTRV